MDSEDTQCNHKARQVPGLREDQSSCVPALLTLLLILFHFLNINIEALLSSKGGCGSNLQAWLHGSPQSDCW